MFALLRVEPYTVAREDRYGDEVDGGPELWVLILFDHRLLLLFCELFHCVAQITLVIIFLNLVENVYVVPRARVRRRRFVLAVRAFTQLVGVEDAQLLLVGLLHHFELHGCCEAKQDQDS